MNFMGESGRGRAETASTVQIRDDRVADALIAQSSLHAILQCGIKFQTGYQQVQEQRDTLLRRAAIIKCHTMSCHTK